MTTDVVKQRSNIITKSPMLSILAESLFDEGNQNKVLIRKIAGF